MALLVVAVVGNTYFADIGLLYRVLGVVVLCALAGLIALTTTKGRDLVELAISAKKEIQRVVWPTRPETIQTTAIVLVAVLVVGLMLWYELGKVVKRSAGQASSVAFAFANGVPRHFFRDCLRRSSVNFSVPDAKCALMTHTASLAVASGCKPDRRHTKACAVRDECSGTRPTMR